MVGQGTFTVAMITISKRFSLIQMECTSVGLGMRVGLGRREYIREDWGGVTYIQRFSAATPTAPYGRIPPNSLHPAMLHNATSAILLTEKIKY